MRQSALVNTVLLLSYATTFWPAFVLSAGTQLVYPPFPMPGPPSDIGVSNIRPIVVMFEPHHSADKRSTQYIIAGVDKPAVLNTDIFKYEFQRILPNDDCKVLPNENEFFVHQPIITCQYNATVVMVNLNCYERPTEYPRQVLDVFYCHTLWYVANVP